MSCPLCQSIWLTKNQCKIFLTFKNLLTKAKFDIPPSIQSSWSFTPTWKRYRNTMDKLGRGGPEHWDGKENYSLGHLTAPLGRKRTRIRLDNILPYIHLAGNNATPSWKGSIYLNVHNNSADIVIFSSPSSEVESFTSCTITSNSYSLTSLREPNHTLEIRTRRAIPLHQWTMIHCYKFLTPSSSLLRVTPCTSYIWIPQMIWQYRHSWHTQPNHTTLTWTLSQTLHQQMARQNGNTLGCKNMMTSSLKIGFGGQKPNKILAFLWQIKHKILLVAF